MSFTSVFQQKISLVSADMVYRQVLQTAKTRRKKLFFAINLHILLLLKKKPSFQKYFNQAAVIFADGMPLVWFSQLTSRPLPERISGTQLTEKLLSTAGLKIFALGSTAGVLEKLSAQYSKTVCGTYAPPTRDFYGAHENRKITALIRRSKAQLVLVAFGSLKQEKWLISNFRKTGAFAAIGVGSAFEILTGEKPRAPYLWQQWGMEWLWRIFLEPRRLLPRYVEDLFLLAQLIVRTVMRRFTAVFSHF